jgi:hypothetical protein
MWDTIWGFGDSVVQQTGRLDRTQWLFVFVGIVVIGFVCMRGFGSRSNY